MDTDSHIHINTHRTPYEDEGRNPLMHLQTRNVTDFWQTPENARGKTRFSPTAIRGSRTLPILDLGLSAPRTVRQLLSVFLSHPVTSPLLQSPQEMNTGMYLGVELLDHCFTIKELPDCFLKKLYHLVVFNKLLVISKPPSNTVSSSVCYFALDK